jgi:methyl-accepting chemotaxis protein
MQRYVMAQADDGDIAFEPVTASVGKPEVAGAADRVARSLEAIQRLSPPDFVRGLGPKLDITARFSGAERRRSMRLPFSAPAQIVVDDLVQQVRTRDIGIGGMLTERPDDFITAESRACRVEIEGLGVAQGEIVAINFSTLSIRFSEQDQSTLLDRLPALMRRLGERNLAALSDVSRMADQLEVALTRALARGVVDASALFSPPSTPIAGSDPQQRRHPAAAALGTILPPVLAQFWRPERGVAYAVAVDRHGYVPVHNPPFALDQKPGEPVFNHNLSRHARIYDDQWTQCAARVANTPFVTVEERDVAPQFGQVVRAVSAPVTVMNRRWGAARIAWVMRDDASFSSSEGCEEPSLA